MRRVHIVAPAMFKGRHFDPSIILLRVRWYLSLGNLKEMLAERGVCVDHSTIHRCVIHFKPKLAERFNMASAR